MPASRRPLIAAARRASQNRRSRAAVVNISGDASRVTTSANAIPRCCYDDDEAVVVAMPIRGR